MRQGQSLSRLLAATTAALLLIGYSLEIPQNPFATNHCTAHQDTHQVPTTCTIIDLDESDSGLSLQVRQSAEIDIPMQDWFNGDIDNITDSSTWVLTPEDADTGSALNGHWGGPDTILRFRAFALGTAEIVEENHNQDESFAVRVVVS